MSDTVIGANYQRLDSGLKRTLKQTVSAFEEVRDELLRRPPAEESTSYLWRWAIIYTIILRDLGNSAKRLLTDGKHSRAVTMLRRVAFEYRTRFHHFRSNSDEAKTAQEEFELIAQRFADRLGPEEVTLLLDPAFKRTDFDAAKKTYRKFAAVCEVVYGASWESGYARFYSYPSALLHGDALASMDVLERIDDQDWRIHVDSRRPYTNELAGNFIVFLLDFAMDVAAEYDLQISQDLKTIGEEFNKVRYRLGIGPTN